MLSLVMLKCFCSSHFSSSALLDRLNPSYVFFMNTSSVSDNRNKEAGEQICFQWPRRCFNHKSSAELMAILLRVYTKAWEKAGCHTDVLSDSLYFFSLNILSVQKKTIIWKFQEYFFHLNVECSHRCSTVPYRQ